MTPRIHVPGGWPGIGADVELAPDQHHHLVTVLRRRTGDLVELFDGEGNAATARLESGSGTGPDASAGAGAGAGAGTDAGGSGGGTRGRGGRIRGRDRDGRPDRARIVALLPVEPGSPLAITVGQAISSAERMDWTLEKAVEVGVDRIVPLQSARAAPVPAADRLERRLLHWHRILAGACAQSGRSRLPRLETPRSPEAWLSTESAQHRLLLLPGASQSLAATIDAVPADPVDPRRRPLSVALACGPEAGFDAAEAQLFVDHGWKVVGLGPRTLRTETAALVAVAIIQSRWGDLR